MIRRSLVRALLTGLVTCLGLSAGVGAVNGNNLLRNPGFEDGTNGKPTEWRTYTNLGKAEYSWDERIAHSGRHSVKISADAPATANWLCYCKKDIPPAGTKMILTAYAKTKDVSGGAVYIYSGITSPGPKRLSGTQDWTKLSTVGTVPPNCSSIQVVLRLDAKGTVWFDDVDFQEYKPAKEIQLERDVNVIKNHCYTLRIPQTPKGSAGEVVIKIFGKGIVNISRQIMFSERSFAAWFMAHKSGKVKISQHGSVEGLVNLADAVFEENKSLLLDPEIDPKVYDHLWREERIAGEKSRRGIHIHKASPEKDMILAAHGESKYSIVVPKNPSATVSLAAHELQKYCEKVSGVLLPVITDHKPTGGNRIYVGTIAESRELESLAAQYNLKNPEAFVVKTMKRDLYLVGVGDVGTLYAVYEFLERHLNIRWLMPGLEGEVVPKRKTIVLGEISDIESPDFETRGGVGGLEAGPPSAHRLVMEWMVRNRMNWGKVGHSRHSPEWFDFARTRGINITTANDHIDCWLPPEKYFKEHPEYYPLIAGRRWPAHNPGTQINYANPEVIRIVAENVKRETEKFPGIKTHGLGINDHWGYHDSWGDDEWSEKIEGPAKKYWPGQSKSQRYLSFVNGVAKEVSRTHPDRWLGYVAYSNTVAFPEGTKPHKKVMIAFCYNGRCLRCPFDSEECPMNRYLRTELERWIRTGNPVYVWDVMSAYSLVPQNVVSDEDLGYFRKVGLKGLMLSVKSLRGAPETLRPTGWELYGASILLLTRKLWNAELDTGNLVRKYCQGYYGKAAQPMTEYYLKLMAGARRIKGHYTFREARLPEKIDSETLRKCSDYLDEALKLADDELTSRRVQILRHRFPLYAGKVPK